MKQIKLRYGDSPDGIRDLRTLEGVNVPFLKENHLDYQAHKDGLFREVVLTPGGDRYYTYGGAGVNGAPLPYPGVAKSSPSSREKFHTTKIAAGTVHLDDGTAVAGSAQYIGGGQWAYIGQEALHTSTVLADTYAARRLTQGNDFTIRSGRRAKAPYEFGLVWSYTDFVNNLFFDGGAPTGTSFEAGFWQFHIIPLQVNGGVVALVTTTGEIGNTDPWGVPVHDIIIGIAAKGQSEPPLFAAITRRPQDLDKSILGFPFIVVTPQIWVGLSAVLFTPYPGGVSSNYGGTMLLYKTVDGGTTWTISNNSQFEHLLADAPATPCSSAISYACRRNFGLAISCAYQNWCVVTPDIWLVSFPNYGAFVPAFVGDTKPASFYDVDSTFNFNARWMRTIDGGTSWSEVGMPGLIEPVSTWTGWDPYVYLVRDMTYLGRGVLLATVRAGFEDERTFPFDGDSNLEWNMIRSTDFGASWTCIPKSGLPAAAIYSRHVGAFKVEKKGVGLKAGRVLLPIWGGDGVYLYASVDDGDTWTKSTLVAKSENCAPMAPPGEFWPGVGVFVNSFRELTIHGLDSAPTPPSIEAEWRYDTNKPWVHE